MNQAVFDPAMWRLGLGRALIVVLCGCGWPAVAAAELTEPLDLVPAESLLCWSGRPLPDTAPLSDQPSTLQTLLDLGTRLAGSAGKLDAGARLGMRSAEMFNLLIRYPHALVLIDARAVPLRTDAESRQVDRLRFALVVQCGDEAEAFLRIIQKAVNELTSAENAQLAARTAARWRFQELRDQRLPPWSAIAWGRIDGFFVLTVGEQVWEDVAAVAAGEKVAVSQEPWYQTARVTQLGTTLIEIFVAARDIRTRLDPFVHDRATAFFNAWDADKLDQAHWAIGFRERALFCVAHFRFGDQTERRVYADPSLREPRLMATIPDGARYAIYTLPIDRFLRRFFAGLVSLQDAKTQAEVQQVWADLQARHGFDAQADILNHVGTHVVLHNFPLHPLRLPLAMTTLIEIRAEPERVRGAIETFCHAWQQAIEQAARENEHPPEFTVHRDSDGVWYLRFGPLAGIAWTTTDRYLITCWSPHALREYLAKVGDAVGKR